MASSILQLGFSIYNLVPFGYDGTLHIKIRPCWLAESLCFLMQFVTGRECRSERGRLRLLQPSSQPDLTLQGAKSHW